MVSKYTPSGLRNELKKHEEGRRAIIENMDGRPLHDPVVQHQLFHMLVSDTAYYLDVIDHLAERLEAVEAKLETLALGKAPHSGPA